MAITAAIITFIISSINIVDLDLKNEIGVTISKLVSDMKNGIKTEL